ncbi:MAG: potassium channel family protein [Nitrospirae bacterium]|nr:potassium channel family protein [Nitrospirota bacterium]
MEFTFEFLRLLFLGLAHISPVLVSLALAIVVLGQIVGRKEAWSRYDALYWSFITATTVGYGDIKPSHRISKVLSVLIALIGLLFTGIVVAAAIHAATHTFSKYGVF